MAPALVLLGTLQLINHMAASSRGAAVCVPAVPAPGECTLQEGSWGFDVFIWGPETPMGTSQPFPMDGDSLWAPVPSWDRANPAKRDQAKHAEIRPALGWDAPPLHGEVRCGGLLHRPPSFNTTAAWHCILSRF